MCVRACVRARGCGCACGLSRLSFPEDKVAWPDSGPHGMAWLGASWLRWLRWLCVGSPFVVSLPLAFWGHGAGDFVQQHCAYLDVNVERPRLPAVKMIARAGQTFTTRCWVVAENAQVCFTAFRVIGCRPCGLAPRRPSVVRPNGRRRRYSTCPQTRQRTRVSCAVVVGRTAQPTRSDAQACLQDPCKSSLGVAWRRVAGASWSERWSRRRVAGRGCDKLA